ncbi:MAG: ABC transporter ATP-binding protein [Spirochaetales bacterium]|nr:ABC transporter ATP-binding protein [Spirochaetales bacterium]
MDTLLTVDNLQVAFNTDDGEIVGVENVGFNIKKGEVLCIVGESGCGKSVTALSLMGLLGKNGFIKQGDAFFDGHDLRSLSSEEMRKLRGNRFSMIFQEPMTSLNPVLTVGRQLLEPVELHLGLKGEAAKKLCIEWLEKVGIPRPEKVFSDYPGTLSGGMRQRVMIAMAMICSPSLLIADEPTTALDVTIQSQILDLMEELRLESESSILLITHDLGVVAETADRVLVMYAGQVVEEADVFELFENPQHPYTKGLLASIPNVSDDFTERLKSIPGNVPSLQNMPKGCRFCERCSFSMDVCKTEVPPLFDVFPNHKMRCWLGDNK